MGLTAQQIAEKQVRKAQSSVQDWKDGIMAVKTSPAQAAAARVDAWFAGLQKAYNDGTYQDGLAGVTLQAWQDAAIRKGGTSYAPGIQAAQATIADFHSQRIQHQAGLDQQLAAMPRGDLSTNIQRMVTQVTGMSNFKFKKRR